MEPIRKAKKEIKRSEPKPQITDPITKSVGNKHSTIRQIQIMDQKLVEITQNAKKCMQNCPNLQSIMLSNCNLKSLANMPNIPNLLDLDLSINEISDSELTHLKKYTKLQNLNLGQNKITKLGTIKVLKPLDKLQRIVLMDNEIEKLPDYHKEVFGLFKNLNYLDNTDRQGNEVNLDDEQYDDSEQDEQNEEDQEEQQSPQVNKNKQKYMKNTKAEDEDSEDQQFQPDGEYQDEQGDEMKYGIASDEDEEQQGQGSGQSQQELSIDDSEEESRP